jgi:glycerophosphoryl diester phosphodiesterase
MQLTILQPPYPVEETPAAALACLEWQRQRLAELKPETTDFVLLPEYANVPGLAGEELLAFLRQEGARFVAELASEARRLEAWLAVGTVIEQGGRLHNRTLVFSPDGGTAGHYDKVHLPTSERDAGIVPGAEIPVVDLGPLRLGFAVCFDAYFPEHFAALAAQQPDLIVSPSYQRSEEPERIECMSRCRALDTGACLVRASYAMPNGKGGTSLVVAADGTVVASAGSEPGVLRTQLNPRQRYLKPASHGQPEIEHRELMELRRRAPLYRPNPGQVEALVGAPFPRLCAHRGLSHLCPENTLPALGAALALPEVSEIELDLWLSADGVPVVCHDPRVDRTTDGQGIVTELAWEEIRSFDAGCRLDERWRGVRLPRFEEVLDLVNGRAMINIHIKAPGPDDQLVKLVADLLRKRGMVRLGYIAGDEDVLRAALAYAPEIDRACLAHQGDPPRLIDTAVRYQCQRLQFGRNVEPEHCAAAGRAGLIRNLFWSDELEDARHYAAMGIDVILTNEAHRILPLVPGQ